MAGRLAEKTSSRWMTLKVSK